MTKTTAPLRMLLAAYREAVKLHDSNHDDAFTSAAHNAILAVTPPTVREPKAATIILREFAKELRLEDRAVGIFADEDTARLVDWLASLVEAEAAPAGATVVRHCNTCAHRERQVCSGCGGPFNFPSWEPATIAPAPTFTTWGDA